MERDEAYTAGRTAFADGLALHENPYVPLSPEWHDWQRGWCDAQEDDL